MVKVFDEARALVWAEEYENKVSSKELAEKYGVSSETIIRSIKRVRGIGAIRKQSPLTTYKEEVIYLYTVERRGKSYIGKLFGVRDSTVSYWLNQWGVKTIPRAEISKRIREIYGPTKGFTGRKHRPESKAQITSTLIKGWESQDRQAKIKHSYTYETIVGRVLGKHEVAYLQKLFDDGLPLPILCKRRYKTPYGSYKPDFEFPDRFIEIKSWYTLDVAKGIRPYKNEKCSGRQWAKICWLNDNVKRVEVIVLESNDSNREFNRAKLTGILIR